MNNNGYKYANCQLYIPQVKTCQIMIPQMQGRIKPEDYCSKHTQNLAICERCQGATLIPFIRYDKENNEVHVYCGNCDGIDFSRQNS